MNRILGVDPGSRITGYGIIDFDGERSVHVASGCIKTADGELPQRLGMIFTGLAEVIDTYLPQEMAVEKVFLNRNADSALKLGQARGAAVVAGVERALPVFEFTATQIKQSIVGRGHADKGQVQHMVKILLCLRETPPVDAADALAVALCHGHMSTGFAKVASGVTSRRRRRYR